MTTDGTIAPATAARTLPRQLPGPVRWIASGTILILLPKCLACVAGYAALAAGLGLGLANRELCGGTATSNAGFWAEGATQLLLELVVTAGLSCFVARPVRRFIRGWSDLRIPPSRDRLGWRRMDPRFHGEVAVAPKAGRLERGRPRPRDVRKMRRSLLREYFLRPLSGIGRLVR
jgi:hypothetical protein